MLIILSVMLYLYLVLLLFGFRLTVKRYEFESSKIEKEVVYAVVSDLHGSSFGANNQQLFDSIANEKPDAVLFPGDIFKDENDHEAISAFLTALNQKYPCFYVYGNHELKSGQAINIASWIKKTGVTVLNNQKTSIVLNGQAVAIYGLADPSFYFQSMELELDKLASQMDEETYSILISHRPEYAQMYAEYGFDLVCSGHAHGGHWRIPFLLNGLFAPNQGFFPEYAGGLYEIGTQKLVVSRGLARKYIIPRIFNPTELVIIKVKPNN